MYERVNDKVADNEPKVRKSTTLTREREAAGRRRAFKRSCTIRRQIEVRDRRDEIQERAEH